jgi:hypothetical protein
VPYALGRRIAPLPPRTPQLRDHAISQVAAPPKLIRSHIPFAPSLYANDEVGDCTCAALANLMRGQAMTKGFDIAGITTGQVLALYSRFGYVAGDPATDQGATMTEVLASQLHTNWDLGPNEQAVALWASIDPGDLNAVRNACCRAGGVYVGLNLAQADMPPAEIWDIDTPVSAGDPTPGSEGGHAVMLWDYSGLADSDTVRIVTWGGFQLATWRWVASRMDEAHLVNWPQFGGVTGVDCPALEAACNAV